LQRDYSELAEAIVLTALFKNGVNWNDESRHLNFWTRLGKGEIHWNDILRINKTRQLLFQQNINSGHFRVVRIANNGQRSRLAWNANLHTLLTQFQVKASEIY